MSSKHIRTEYLYCLLRQHGNMHLDTICMSTIEPNAETAETQQTAEKHPSIDALHAVEKLAVDSMGSRQRETLGMLEAAVDHFTHIGIMPHTNSEYLLALFHRQRTHGIRRRVLCAEYVHALIDVACFQESEHANEIDGRGNIHITIDLFNDLMTKGWKVPVISSSGGNSRSSSVYNSHADVEHTETAIDYIIRKGNDARESLATREKTVVELLERYRTSVRGEHAGHVSHYVQGMLRVLMMQRRMHLLRDIVDMFLRLRKVFVIRVHSPFEIEEHKKRTISNLYKAYYSASMKLDQNKMIVDFTINYKPSSSDGADKGAMECYTSDGNKQEELTFAMNLVRTMVQPEHVNLLIKRLEECLASTTIK